MQPKYLRSLFLLLLLNLLIKPFWLLGIDRTVQNMVGTETYGIYYALFNLSFYLQILLDPGLHTFNNRSLAQDQSLLPGYVSSFIPLKLLLSLAYLMFTLITGWLLGYGMHELQLLWWIALSQALASYVLYMRSNLAGVYLFNTDSIFSVLDRLLMILICGTLIWGNVTKTVFRIEWFVYAQTAATTLTAIAATIAVLRHSKFFRPRIKLSALYGVLRQSYPFALLTILMTLYTRIDSLMLERLLPDGDYQAGVYASAYRLLDAANMIAFLFATILLPVFSGLIHRKESVAETASVSFRLLIIPGILLALASFFFRNEIMQLLYHEATAFSAQVFGTLMFGFLALCTVYVYGTLLTANGSLRFLNITSALGLAANVVLNFLLIYRYGALGAVIATLATQMLVSGIQYIKAHRVFSIPLINRHSVRLLLYAGVAVLSFTLFDALPMNWLLKLFALTAINLTFALAIGLLDIRYFLKILKLKNR